jgi:hypothetical protein
MYFTLEQLRYLWISIFGGALLVSVLGLAIWNYRSRKAIEKAKESQAEEFPDGLQEGHNSVPLMMKLLIPTIAIWGVAYAILHAMGVFYAQ